MAHLLRTRFKKDIVAEFLPPKRKTKKTRVIIICSGMPAMPSQKRLMEFLSRKGFWSFFPRYRGTWESGGSFLAKSPERDVIDIIDQLPRGFVDAWSGKKNKVKPDELFIVATSFGGPAGILASRDKRVNKAFVVSPVIDWQAPSKTESLAFMERFVPGAFGNGYRMRVKDWRKLATGKFYNPVHVAGEIDGRKLFIVHAKDDDVVRAKEVIGFAKRTGAKFKLMKKGGHLRMGDIVQRQWREIGRFLRG